MSTLMCLSPSTKEKYNVINTDKTILNKITEMLKVTDDIFTKNNIVYWIDGGTLLGAIRHKNIIPWDDDADLCLDYRFEDKFLTLRNQFVEKGYDIAPFWGGYKIFPIDGKRIQVENKNWSWTGNQSKNNNNQDNDIKYKYPFIDIFFCKKDKENNNIVYANKKVNDIYKKYYHETDHLYPLKKYNFGNIMLWGPNNPIPYLDRAFGTDWSNTGYRSYDHLNQQFITPTKFKL